MDLGKNELVVAESKLELKIEGDGEEDMMISCGEKGGIDEAPNDIENPKDPLLEELEELENLPPLFPMACIYRVPERLRNGNEKACTPRLVSIGPLHHGRQHLKAMEVHKKMYLKQFLSRTRVSLPDFRKKIRDQEERLRGCYKEIINFDSDVFVSIVLVDAAFVIEFLLRCFSMESQGEADHTFNMSEMCDVRLDLLLLENQLPFFLLQDLFSALSSSSHQLPSLLRISYTFFNSEIVDFGIISSYGKEVQHFVDLLRDLYVPPYITREDLPWDTITEEENTTPNVTELCRAGVELKVSTDRSLFDIQFVNAILKIPKLTVEETTDLTLRNILAFEQCHHRTEDYLTNYVSFMNRLVKTPEDVELLVEKGIIENRLRDTQKISTLLHDLGNGLPVSNPYLAFLCKDLHRYYTDDQRHIVSRTRRYRWKETLRKNYLDTPWSIISVVAAAILLILTFIQTVCSVISTA